MAATQESGGPVEVLVGNISSLFTNSRYANLTIACKERKRKVHKNIVCTGCDFFAKACNGSFNLGSPSTLQLYATDQRQEASEGVVTLPEHSPDVVNALLAFLYKANYDDKPNNTQESGSGSGSTSLFNTQIVWLADKYNIPSLGALATKKYKARADELRNTSAFIDAIEETHTGPDVPGIKALRTHLITATARNFEKYMTGDLSERVCHVTGKLPNFLIKALHLVAGRVQRLRAVTWHRCPGECGYSAPIPTTTFDPGGRTIQYQNCGKGFGQKRW